MLGPSLYDFLRKNNYRPFPVDLVRELGRQMLECVACVYLLLQCSYYLFQVFSSNVMEYLTISFLFFLFEVLHT